jgi:hypothetical protein
LGSTTIQGRRAVQPATNIVAGRSGRRAADPHFEIAVHIELEHKTVTAMAVGGPGAYVFRNVVTVARDPDVVAMVDIDAVLDVGPDAACFLLAVIGQPARVGRTAPRAQQLTVGVEFQHPGRGTAAIRTKAIDTSLAQPIHFLPLGVGNAGQSLYKTGFIIRHGARSIVDPDVIVQVDIQAANLAENPVIWQRLWPSGIDYE